MKRRPALLVVAILACLSLPAPALAGGAWVPAPGHFFAGLGYSRKTGNTSFDARGQPFANRYAEPRDPGDLRLNTGDLIPHEYNYLLLVGEIGVFKRFSFTYALTLLYGFEGLPGRQDRFVGPSDAWLGYKFAFNDLIRLPSWPLAFSFTARVPWLYSYPNGTLNGLRKYDLTPSLLASKALPKGYGWVNAEAGLVLRAGAPAHQAFFDLNFAVRVPLPTKVFRLFVKADLYGAFSIGPGNDPLPSDRFNHAVGSVYNYNDASVVRVFAGLLALPWRGLLVEVSYGRWVWGQSVVRYDELYAGLGWSY